MQRSVTVETRWIVATLLALYLALMGALFTLSFMGHKPCPLAVERYRTHHRIQRCLYKLGPCTLWYDATNDTHHTACTTRPKAPAPAPQPEPLPEPPKPESTPLPGIEPVDVVERAKVLELLNKLPPALPRRRPEAGAWRGEQADRGRQGFVSDKETARLLTACGCSKVVETEIASRIAVPYRRGYGVVDAKAMWPTDHSLEGRMAYDRKVFGPVYHREFRLAGRDPEDRERWLYREVVE